MLRYLCASLLIAVIIHFVISAVPPPNESLSLGISAVRIRRSEIVVNKLGSYRSFSITLPDGRKKTTLWYYNPKGPNYKFSIYGDLPALDEDMVEWLEDNHYRYQVTQVPYKGDAKETAMRELFPADCGQRHLRIVEGKEAKIEDYPWQVALIHSVHKELKCGGSIITYRHVITAAHCFDFHANSNLANKNNRLVVAGVKDLSDRENEYAILHLLLRGDYNKDTTENDIALIMIDSEFSLGIKLYPICLPSQNENLRVGRTCKISGWGKINATRRQDDALLRAAEVKVTTDQQCRAKNSQSMWRRIGSKVFCAGNYEKGGADTCQGDSGGPLACEERNQFTLFGVTSWGVGCGKAGFPGVYTKVPKYVNWILKAVDVTLSLKET